MGLDWLDSLPVLDGSFREWHVSKGNDGDWCHSGPKLAMSKFSNDWTSKVGDGLFETWVDISVVSVLLVQLSTACLGRDLQRHVDIPVRSNGGNVGDPVQISSGRVGAPK